MSVMDILNPLPISYEDILSSVSVDKKIEDKNKVEKANSIFIRSSEVVEKVRWSKAYKGDQYALFSGFSIRGKQVSPYNTYFIELNLNYSKQKEIERKAGGSTLFNIIQEILYSLSVLIPKLSEQNQINLFFTKIDDTITLHHGMSNLTFYKKYFLKNNSVFVRKHNLFSKNNNTEFFSLYDNQ